MARIKLEELPKTIQAMLAGFEKKIVSITASLTKDGDEQYIIKTRDGHKDRWRYVDHEWRVV